MSLATTAQSIEQHTKDAYTALQSGGVELPSEKNLANLASTINNYFHPPTGEFGLLKRAMQDGTYLQKFPVGAEIDDTDPLSNNQINPWRIVNYGEYNLASGGSMFGAVLLRKYAPITYMLFDEVPSDHLLWVNSTIRTYLNGAYLGQCSPALQASASKITIKSKQQGTSTMTSDDTIWLPSASEYNGAIDSLRPNLGAPFSYFSALIGSPTDSATSARIIQRLDTKEAAYFCATRDGYDYGGNGTVVGVYSTGAIVARSGSMSPVPACFIAADS